MNRPRAALVLASLLAVLFAREAFAQKVVVTYFSRTGHTKAMAEAVAKGARSTPGAEVRLQTIDKTTKEDLLWADAIIVGSPVNMTSVAPEVTTAINAWPFQAMQDKIGAAFVTGGGISTGEELTQMQLIEALMMCRMVIVGGPSILQAFGASAITGEKPFADEKNAGAVDPMFLAKGEGLGKRVAEIAKMLVAGRNCPSGSPRSIR
jgi:NAD(P)H dehydrogenase (quinone)